MALRKFEPLRKVLLMLTSMGIIVLLTADKQLVKLDQLAEGAEMYQVQNRHNNLAQHPPLPLFDATTLTSSSIDYTVSERITWPNEDKCDKILLFFPYFFAGHGQGFQLNTYLMAAMVAAFTDRALVLFEPPRENNRFDTWSQVGCPSDAFEDDSRSKVKDGFPEGLTRLIQHPTWISRGCGIPTCQGKRNYGQWVQLREQQRNHFGRAKSKKYVLPLTWDCNEGGRNINVMPLDGADLRMAFDRIIHPEMISRSSDESRDKAYHWALRLGASTQEAEYFTTIESDVDISDFVASLINRSGLLKFQPWIARDVAQYIQSSNLPVDSAFDAIHVRRGDKLIAESKPIVQKYWMSKGYKKNRLPTNFVPFNHYLEMGYEQNNTCPAATILQEQPSIVNIYIATDDPATVQQEISQLPKSESGYAILNDCQHAYFIFSPASNVTDNFHMTPCGNYVGTCEEDNCDKRYQRNIAAMADFFILSRANKFVGEYNSNWGRIVKGFRTMFSPSYNGMYDVSPVMIRDVVEVFGYPPTFFGY